MTKLDKAKEIAVEFLYTELSPSSDDENSFLSLYACHPFFDTVFLCDQKGIFDARKEPDRLLHLQNEIEAHIKAQKSVEGILFYIRKPFKIEYIIHLHCSKKFSDKDCGLFLRDIWTEIENNETQDDEVTSLMEKWLMAVPKEKLMKGSDYKTYLSFPEELTVYRGVQREEAPVGFSWTTDIDIARWFAERFNNDETEICQLTISKQDIVFYTNEVKEKEVVLIPSLIDEDMIEFL